MAHISATATGIWIFFRFYVYASRPRHLLPFCIDVTHVLPRPERCEPAIYLRSVQKNGYVRLADKVAILWCIILDKLRCVSCVQDLRDVQCTPKSCMFLPGCTHRRLGTSLHKMTRRSVSHAVLSLLCHGVVRDNTRSPAEEDVNNSRGNPRQIERKILSLRTDGTGHYQLPPVTSASQVQTTHVFF